jgi:hypothetical protein
MPRELADVLHYLLPESEQDGSAAQQASRPPRGSRPGSEPEGRAVLWVPLAPHDVVRGALVWNLAIEGARQGSTVRLVSPAAAPCASWPPPGRGPLGIETVAVDGGGVAGLARAAAAAPPAGGAGPTALTLVGVPIDWIQGGAAEEADVDWLLLLARPDERDLLEAWTVLEAVAQRAPGARIGVSIFGVRSLADARRTFDGLAALADLELARELVSYGVLIDDVHLSRSIVAQRPIALAQPSSPAARALADVAGMLLADAGAVPGRG